MNWNIVVIVLIMLLAFFMLAGKVKSENFITNIGPGRVYMYKDTDFLGDRETYLLSTPEAAKNPRPGSIYPNPGSGKTKCIFQSEIKQNSEHETPELFGTHSGFLSIKSEHFIPLEILSNGIVDTRVSSKSISDIRKFILDNISPDFKDGIVEVRTFVDIFM